MANKHAAYDLAQMQSLPLEAKILTGVCAADGVIKILYTDEDFLIEV